MLRQGWSAGAQPAEEGAADRVTVDMRAAARQTKEWQDAEDAEWAARQATVAAQAEEAQRAKRQARAAAEEQERVRVRPACMLEQVECEQLPQGCPALEPQLGLRSCPAACCSEGAVPGPGEAPLLTAAELACATCPDGHSSAGAHHWSVAFWSGVNMRWSPDLSCCEGASGTSLLIRSQPAGPAASECI